MSNGDDVLDNWEEIDEAGLCNKLDKLHADIQTQQKPEFVTEFTKKSPTASLNNTPSDLNTSVVLTETATAIDQSCSSEPTFGNMKLLQRPSMQDNDNIINLSSSTTSSAITVGTADVLKSPLEDMASSFQPVMMLLNKTNDEYESANYTQTINAQTVKILRRPTQSSEPRNNDQKPKQPIKTLKQREQEYAEARLRILGAAKNPDDDVLVESGENNKVATTITPTTSTNNLINNTKPSTSNAGCNVGASTSAERYLNRSNGTKNHPLNPSTTNQFNINATNNNNSGMYYYNLKSQQPTSQQQQQGMPTPPPSQQQQQQPIYQQQYQQFQQAPNNFFYPTLYMQQQQGPLSAQLQASSNLYNNRSMTMLPPPPPMHQFPPAQLLLQQQQQHPPQPSPQSAAQLTWSPIVGGNVSATNLLQQQQQQSRNESVLRLPRGPDGSNGFQVRR